MLLKEGELIGGSYEVICQHDRGGMALIYRVRDRAFPRVLALKVLMATRGQDPRQVEYFEREAQVMATLRHAGVPAIYAYGELQGHPFVVMDFLEGETLAKRLRRLGTLEPTAVLDICEQIGDVLTAAHERGIVHRDLKPENIFLLSGGRRQQVKVLDFGISRFAHASGAAATAPGMLLGTPEFMSPEQARGDTSQVGPATDIYALGMIAYVMLSGQPAFRLPQEESLSPVALINHITRVNQEPPAPLGPNIGAGVAAVILRALAKNPHERFPSVGDFLDSLREAHRADATAPTRSGTHLPTAPTPTPSAQFPLEAPISPLRTSASRLALSFASGLLLGALVVWFSARTSLPKVTAANLPVTPEPAQPAAPPPPQPSIVVAHTAAPAAATAPVSDRLPSGEPPLASAHGIAPPRPASKPPLPPRQATTSPPPSSAPRTPPAASPSPAGARPPAPCCVPVLQSPDGTPIHLSPELTQAFTEPVATLQICREGGQQILLNLNLRDGRYACISGCGDTPAQLANRVWSWLAKIPDLPSATLPPRISISCQKQP